MNEWCAPHRLISVSVFENEHPNTNKVVNIAVLQRGKGDKRNVIEKSTPEVVTRIYDFSVSLDNKGWESLIKQATNLAKSFDRSFFTTFNYTSEGTGDQQGSLVLSWAKAYEDALIDNERGGC